MSYRNFVLRIPLLLLAVAATLVAQDKPNNGDKSIDTQNSSIRIHVGKAGAFTAAGHEHWVTAPIASGTLSETDNPHVEFQVQAAKLQVEADPKDNKHQAEIQQTMQEKVLESGKYPEIRFRSATVEKVAEGKWTVKGSLTLHGTTAPIVVNVTKERDIYGGSAVIKQTDFAIKPISVGGLVKVKDELEITFQVTSK